MDTNGQPADTLKPATDAKISQTEVKWSYKIQRMGGLARISLSISASAAELFSPHATGWDSR
jgi:hypothetical protein